MRLLLAAAILLMAAPVFCLSISEVMYAPVDDESYNEWVEVYNDADIGVSLENWTICNSSLLPGFVDHSNQSLPIVNDSGFVLPPFSYAMITDGGTGTLVYSHLSPIGMAFHTSKSSVCGGLSDSNDTIILENASLSVIFSYDSSVGGLKNNRTICSINSDLHECLPTPGYENRKAPSVLVNVVPGQMNITADTCDTLPLEINYSIDGIENSLYANMTCSASIAIPQSGEVCWNMTLPEAQSGCVRLFPEPESCASVSISGPSIVNASQSFGYYLDVNSSMEGDYVIQYWIEDLWGNIIKDPVNTTQHVAGLVHVQRSWTPGDEDFLIKSSTVCSQFELPVMVMHAAKENVSYISLSSLDSASFGDAIPVDLEIYRGSTAKYAIDIWTEQDGKKSSEVVTVYAKKKYSNYSMRVPLKVKSNCDGSLVEGRHQIMASGLDVEASGSINISGQSDECKTIVVQSSSGGSSSFIAMPSAQSSGINITMVSYNESAYAGGGIQTLVNITNMFSSKQNVSIYSYVFRGSSLASVGGWTPNAVQIILNASKSVQIILNNTIKDGAEGLYYLRVRAKADKNYDATAEIMISQAPEALQETATTAMPQANSAGNQDNDTRNETTVLLANMSSAQPTPKNSPPQGNALTAMLFAATVRTKPLAAYMLNLHLISLFSRFLVM